MTALGVQPYLEGQPRDGTSHWDTLYLLPIEATAEAAMHRAPTPCSTDGNCTLLPPSGTASDHWEHLQHPSGKPCIGRRAKGGKVVT